MQPVPAPDTAAIETLLAACRPIDVRRMGAVLGDHATAAVHLGPADVAGGDDPFVAGLRAERAAIAALRAYAGTAGDRAVVVAAVAAMNDDQRTDFGLRAVDAMVLAADVATGAFGDQDDIALVLRLERLAAAVGGVTVVETTADAA
jgi:hypothetical protein